MTLDKDGHARRLITQKDLATALWELGMKEAHKMLQPAHEAPLPGSPAHARREIDAGAWKKEEERREQRAYEAAAVREAAMKTASALSVDELVLAVTLMVCRYALHYHEADQLRRALKLKDAARNRDLYLEAPNAALWAYAKDALTDKKTKEKDRLLLALRILAERPASEPSHDEVLHAVLGVDIKAARRMGRERRKQAQVAKATPSAAK